MKLKIKDYIIKVLLIICGITFVYPVVWILMVSLKSADEVFYNPLGLPRKWLFSNYHDATAAFDFIRYFLNSCVYTIGTIILTTICASLCGYALARMRNRLNKFLTNYIQLGLVLPISAGILSLYLLMKNLGIKNTYQGLILVYTASALSIAITIIYGYLRSLPYELEESAYIDGCGVLRAFISIILPMLSSAIVTIVIITFMNYSWNEYFIAFITVDSVKMRSIPVAIQYFSTNRGTEWGLMGAAMVMTSIPSILVYFVGSEKIEEALTTAAVIK